jgi:release factor glutamine methyltransferase
VIASDQDSLAATIARIAKVAVGSARQEARILHEVAGSDLERLEAFILRRLAGEPVDRIAGHRGFWTLDLMVTPEVLSPRPDTETIVETARDLLLKRHGNQRHGHQGHGNDPSLRFLDLGTGSGAILLALLAEFPNATGVGMDISTSALSVALANVGRNGLQGRADMRVGSWQSIGWDEGFTEQFDLVVSNPPYIPHADLATLEPEVRLHDPMLALDIFPSLPRLLGSDGIAVFEIGYGQHETIPALAVECNLNIVKLVSDLAGIPRALALDTKY